jgi:hypothetical protein
MRTYETRAAKDHYRAHRAMIILQAGHGWHVLVPNGRELFTARRSDVPRLPGLLTLSFTESTRCYPGDVLLSY